MTLVLCDLLGRDGYRFSPYVWRTKMALAHKGLAADIVGITLTDKSALSGWTNYRKAPVLKHGNTIVCDSWHIAVYLEENWPEAPALFPDRASLSFARFLNGWVVSDLYPLLLPLIARDVLDHVHSGDRARYRATREERLGRTLEQAQAQRESEAALFRSRLDPIREVVANSPFLCGDTPCYADYILFGLFQWARCTSAFPLLDHADPLYAWRREMLDLFAGLGREAPGYPC